MARPKRTADDFEVPASPPGASKLVAAEIDRPDVVAEVVEPLALQPPPLVDASTLAGQWSRQNRFARGQRLRTLARQYPEVADLIRENESLKARQ